jgi:lipopolysaccharide heptosyltransferase II
LKKIQRILVIRFSAMGDIILATPLIRWIRKGYPEAELDVLVRSEYSSLLDTHPDVNQVLTWPIRGGLTDLIALQKRIRQRHYDVLIDLQASGRSRWLAFMAGARRTTYYRPKRLKRFLLVCFRLNLFKISVPVPIRYLAAVKLLHIQDDGSGASLFPEDRVKNMVQRLIRQIRKDRMIIMAPGAAHATKQWPLQFYAEVGRFLQTNGFSIVLIGGETDWSVCDRLSGLLDSHPLNLAGKLTFIESAALLQQSRLLVTNDTGVMHMAGAVGTPVVAIFGPTTRELGFFPFRSASRVIEHEQLNCRPCSFHGTARCPRKHFRCMQEILPDQIIQAVKMFIS